MKTRGKVLLATLSAAMLVTASVMGTLAYLQDTETVTNTFTVGKVDITLDEAKTGLDGVVTSGRTEDGNEYKLMPGHKYTKDPVVHVETGSEDSYLFVKVENDIAEIEHTIAGQMEKNGWKLLEGDVYYYNGVATDDDPETDVNEGDYPVFESFTIDGDVEASELATYAPVTSGETTTKKEIKVTAYAVQKDGFDKTGTVATDAAAAWAATYGAEE